jgi:arginine deiminase
MRPERPQPLTREEHLELGRELKQARIKLNELAALVAEVYGPQNHAAFTFQKIIDALDSLSEDMQAQAAEDLRGQAVEGFYT